jgi:PAS domain S-box-containing protein
MEADWRVVWPDGTIHWLAGRATVEMDAAGKPLRMLGVNIDVTDRKLAEEALRRSEVLYRTMARSIPEAAITVVDRTLCYLLVEGKLLDRLGLSKEEIEGCRVQEVLQGELGQTRAEYFRRALAGEPSSYEMEYHGRDIWSQFVPLRDEQGQVWAAMCLNLDITQRKQAEAEIIALRDRIAADLAGMNRLHEVSTRFVRQDDLQRLLAAILNAAIAITGADKGHVQLLDVASGELGITGQRGFDSAFVEHFSHIRAGVVACGTAMQIRQCVVVEDVRLSPLFLAEPRALELVLAAGMRAVVCTPLLTRTSQMVGVLSILFAVPHRPSDRGLRLLDLLARQAADFIERTQAEAALREAQTQLRMITDTMAARVIRCSRDQRFLWVSPAYARWFGRSPEEITGRPMPEVIGETAYEVLRPHIEQVLAGQRVEYEAEVDLLGAGAVCFNSVYTPTYDAAGAVDGWVAVVTDITERKRAEEAQARLAAIVEWSEDAIVSETLDGTIRTWNAGAERMFGYRAEEVIGQPVRLLMPPERFAEQDQALDRIKGGESVDYETVRLTKDGRRLDVSLTISPVKDSQGRIVGASKIARDIGDIVQARQVLARSKEELERLVEERTAMLQETIGELEHFSYTITHDMRAPLRAIQGFAGLLTEECSECLNDARRDHLRLIASSADRMDRLITDALQYSGALRHHPALEPVDSDALLRGILESYPNFQPPHVNIRIDNHLPVVLGDKSGMTQCFSNLLGNAVKFVQPGKTPEVRVWAETQQPSTPLVRIWFEDKGIGIEKQYHDKIWDMFQQLNRRYEGTGIGLALVRKVVARMGGNVGVESEPGHGSRFWVELKAAEIKGQSTSLPEAA